jgi:hypothetical protein
VLVTVQVGVGLGLKVRVGLRVKVAEGVYVGVGVAVKLRIAAERRVRDVINPAAEGHALGDVLVQGPAGARAGPANGPGYEDRV